MKTDTLAYILGVATSFLLFSPFFLPENVIYISKGTDSIYMPYMETLLTISIVVIFVFSIKGLTDFWYDILKSLKDE